MAHHKRRKPRTKVRCNMCTDGRGGNTLKVWGAMRRRQLKLRRDPRIDEYHREAR